MIRTWHIENTVVALTLGAVVLATGGRWIALHAWSALVGCALFLLYPAWRKAWRRIHPLAET